MKIYNWITTILCFILLITTIYLFKKVDVVHDQLNTLATYNEKLQKKLPISAENLIEAQFKEEAYIRQQERDTNLILFLFGFISVGVGFFTFKNVKNEFESKTKNMFDEFEKKIISITDEYNVTKKELIDTKYELYSQMYQSYPNFIKLAEKEGKYELALIYSLMNINCIIKLNIIEKNYYNFKNDSISNLELLSGKIIEYVNNHNVSEIGIQHSTLLNLKKNISIYFIENEINNNELLIAFNELKSTKQPLN